MTEPTSNVVPIDGSQTTVDEWWADSTADDVQGQDLVKDEGQFELVGVPFMATRAIFRAGTQRKGVDYRDDYVSLELRIAPYVVMMAEIGRIQHRRTSADLPPLSELQVATLSGAQLVVNDGSTGLYRQVAQYLEAKGLAELPEEYPMAGERGECRYDLPAHMWHIPDDVPGSIVQVRFAPDSTQVTYFEIRLRCSRGLRFSEYPSPVNPSEKARTWYLA